MTGDLNATLGHRHDLYSAPLLYSYAPHHHFSFKRNFQTQSKDSMPTRQGNTNPIIVRLNHHFPSPDQKRRCEITIISFSRSICRGGLAVLIGVTGKPYPSCLSCHSHPIRPCGAPSPRGEGCDTRIPFFKKSAIPPACESFRPRVSSS